MKYIGQPFLTGPRITHTGFLIDSSKTLIIVLKTVFRRKWNHFVQDVVSTLSDFEGSDATFEVGNFRSRIRLKNRLICSRPHSFYTDAFPRNQISFETSRSERITIDVDYCFCQ
jgi:hypothetical protein